MCVQLSSLPASYMEFLTPEGLQGVKLGVVTQIAQISGMHSAIKALWEQALQDLTAAGKFRVAFCQHRWCASAASFSVPTYACALSTSKSKSNYSL